MAPDSIPPSSSYPEQINKAISECKVCLLIFSNSASLSTWVKKEVSQAISMGKPVLPFRIEETHGSDFFDFILSDTHWIDAYPHYAEKLPSLLKAICAILDEKEPPIPLSGTCKDKSVIREQDPEVYSIGDTLFVDGQMGVIFFIDSSRKHGKVVSADSGLKRWCSREEYLEHRDTHAVSDDDGLLNLRNVQKISEWDSRYPAFKWCAKKGKGWYLPTIADYQLIDKQKAIIAEKIGGIKESQWYWSSEQEGIYSAMYYHFLSGQSHGVGKDNECNVLAVASF